MQATQVYYKSMQHTPNGHVNAMCVAHVYCSDVSLAHAIHMNACMQHSCRIHVLVA